MEPFLINFREVNGMSIELVAREISGILSRHKEIRFAYLYGSFLRGEIYQDIDVAIIVDEDFDRELLYPEGLALEIEKDIRSKYNIEKPVDLHVLNDSRNATYLESVIGADHLLFARDELERARFETRVLRDYLDMKPIHERYDKSRVARYESRF
jgi:uncharacterized protein